MTELLEGKQFNDKDVEKANERIDRVAQFVSGMHIIKFPVARVILYNFSEERTPEETSKTKAFIAEVKGTDFNHIMGVGSEALGLNNKFIDTTWESDDIKKKERIKDYTKRPSKSTDIDSLRSFVTAYMVGANDYKEKLESQGSIDENLQYLTSISNILYDCFKILSNEDIEPEDLGKIYLVLTICEAASRHILPRAFLETDGSVILNGREVAGPNSNEVLFHKIYLASLEGSE